MANNLNSITVVGNITNEPELRFFSNGGANLTFGVAVPRSWMKNGEWQEQTSFFDVVCRFEMAENVAQSLQKGARVIVTGRLEQRSWQTPEGEKRYKIEITAEEVGPSLRYATAQVSRTERRDGQGGGQQQPSQGYSTTGASTGGGLPPQRQPEPAQGGGQYDYGDEEPF